MTRRSRKRDGMPIELVQEKGPKGEELYRVASEEEITAGEKQEKKEEKAEVARTKAVTPSVLNQNKAQPTAQAQAQIAQEKQTTIAEKDKAEKDKQAQAEKANQEASEDTPTENSPYNISEFVKNSKILLISDFEGTTPKTHFDKFKEYCEGAQTAQTAQAPTAPPAQANNKKVIFLGDVFDNTAQFSPDCTGIKCDNPDDETKNCVNYENYCALQTIKLLVDNNERCKYVVGNRDINKIKLLPFFAFKDGKKWWNDGKSYQEIVANLLKKLEEVEQQTIPPGQTVSTEDIQKANPWLIQGDNIKYFQPFWNGKDKVNIWLTKSTDNNINYDISKRFELIFGKDPDNGTMSALVSLKCIPNEFFQTDVMTQIYDEINKIKDAKTAVTAVPVLGIAESENDNQKKIRAALTLAIFMRMLDKDLINEEEEKVVELKIRKPDDKTQFTQNFKALDGYLYTYLQQAAPAYFAQSNKDLFLFAHGGITADFIKKNGNGIEILTATENDAYWNGDVFDEGKKTLKDITLKEKNPTYLSAIAKYNISYTTLVNSFFKNNFASDSKEWKKTMLILLKISAGNLQNVDKNPYDSTLFYPNQIKEPSDQNLDDYWQEGKVYNVFGHGASSSGYSFGKARNKTDGSRNGNNTYFLNTDYSTTLFKNGIKCEKDDQEKDYNKNYLLCFMDTTDESKLKITLEGTLILKEKVLNDKGAKDEGKNYDISYNELTTIQEYDTKNPKIETLFLPKALYTNKKEITINFDPTINLVDIIDDIDEKNTSKKFKFNGRVKVDGDKDDKTYNMFSNMFDKTKPPYSIVLLPETQVVVAKGGGGKKKYTNRIKKYIKKKTKNYRNNKKYNNKTFKRKKNMKRRYTRK